MRKSTSAEAGSVVELKRLVDQEVTLKIKGVTPVIPHAWSEKSKQMMPGHPLKDTMAKKGVRTPVEEAESCLYKLPDGRLGLPAVSFKAAMVSACRFFDKPSMTEARLLFFIVGEGPEQLVPIKGNKTLREDTPRNASGTADLRYRYAIHDWEAEITVRFLPTSISPKSVVALLDAAGRVGVGDWRPGSPKSFTGVYGQFRVEEG